MTKAGCNNQIGQILFFTTTVAQDWQLTGKEEVDNFAHLQNELALLKNIESI